MKNSIYIVLTIMHWLLCKKVVSVFVNIFQYKILHFNLFFHKRMIWLWKWVIISFKLLIEKDLSFEKSLIIRKQGMLVFFKWMTFATEI